MDAVFLRSNLDWERKQEVDHAHKHNHRVSPNSNSHSCQATTGKQSEMQVTCMSHDIRTHTEAVMNASKHWASAHHTRFTPSISSRVDAVVYHQLVYANAALCNIPSLLCTSTHGPYIFSTFVEIFYCSLLLWRTQRSLGTVLLSLVQSAPSLATDQAGGCAMSLP